MDPRRHDEPPPFRATHAAGFLLLIVILVPLLWARASAESTIWIDEIHSLQLSQLQVPRLLDEAARDFHPPGYVLALKLWLKVGRLLGLDPGIVWARALNVTAWLGVAGIYWIGAGALLGARQGALLTACVLGSAAAAVVVRDLRGYAFAFGALAVGVLLLSILESDRRPRRAWPLWMAYATALTGALWSHLLAAPVVALLSLTWLGSRLPAADGRRGRRLALGVIAHAVPWLLFLPWLMEVPDQLVHLRQTSAEWMTPPTAANLLRVFVWWLPLGRISPPSSGAGLLLTALGGLALAAPLAAGFRAWTAGRTRGPAAILSRLSLPTAVASVVFFWLLARLDLAPTFHGPRYPLLVGGILAAGLVGAALAGARRVGTSVALLSFWLAAALAGQVLAIRQESAPGGLTGFRPQVEELASGTGPNLFVTPSELAPFIRGIFPTFTLRPVEELVCARPGSAVVLDVNPWKTLDRTRDMVLSRAILSGRLAAAVERRDWQDAQTSATAYRLDRLDPELAGHLCARGLAPPSPVPAQAVASAKPEDQLAGDGWSYLELDESFDAWRWSARPDVRLRFDRAVPPGSYLLHLKGSRQPYPRERIDLELHMDGGGLDASLPLGPGAIDLVLPVTFRTSRRPVLRIHHPTWSPAETLGSNDPRELAFRFDAAWLTPAPPVRATRQPQ